VEHTSDFDTAGTYNYECPIHSSMTGQIVVADSYSMPSGTEDFTVSAWTKATQADVSLLVLDSDFETQGNWQSAGSGGEVNFDNPTGKLRSESGGSGNNRIPYYDLGTVSETGWIFKMDNGMG